MRIGATAKHEFSNITLPDGESIKLAKVVYAQGNKIVLEKNLTVSGGTATVELTQGDVLKFNASALVQVQIRVLTNSDKAYTSDIMSLKLYDGLDKSVFNQAVAAVEE